MFVSNHLMHAMLNMPPLTASISIVYFQKKKWNYLCIRGKKYGLK
jgi:hypothetical protein